MERYRHYKLLLGANVAILNILADIQTKKSEGFLFDMAYVRGAVNRLGQEVDILVEALVGLSGGRYRELERARQRIAERLQAELAVPEIRPSPLVLPLEEVQDGQFFGGKAEKLGELVRAGFPVPRGFAINAYAQKLFFQQSGLESFVHDAIRSADIRNLDSLRWVEGSIKDRLLATSLPPTLAQALAVAVAELGTERLAVRSSALQEDGLVSFAGQFESFLNVPADMVARRYKEVIASQFTPRALYYCHTSGFSYQELAMGVIVMEMVEAQSAGVMYTADPRNCEPTITVNAIWGLGSVTAGGHAEPDVYRVEGDRLASTKVGDKAHIHLRLPEGGVLEKETPAELQGACLSSAQVLELAELGRAVEQHWGSPQDIEWALDSPGRFSLLQARPLRLTAQAKPSYIPPRLKGVEVLLEQGAIASRGARAGPVFILTDDRDLSRVPQGAVLVAQRAQPEYGLAIGRIAAVVCEMGGVASHLATVLREAGVPAIFGAREATTRLKTGDMVTVDAYYGNIYAGCQEELLRSQPKDLLMQQSRAWRTLERVQEHIIPLNLLDPREENFRPEACRTYHDITRFAHEKAMAELFKFSQGGNYREGARQFKSKLPLEIFVVDLGGGIRPEASESAAIRPEDLTSRPLAAYWRGVEAIGWRGARPLDLVSFISVVMGGASDTQAQDRLQEDNYVIMAADYMNFATRLGYHFTTIESFLGAPGESYITLVYYGGGADLTRRVRRVLFLAKVLRQLDFRVELKGDSLTARIDGYDLETMENRLEALGRLIMVSKQLDMTMNSDALIEDYYQRFIASYDLKV